MAVQTWRQNNTSMYIAIYFKETSTSRNGIVVEIDHNSHCWIKARAAEDCFDFI